MGQIKAGSVVRLKSGGPSMTVDAIQDGVAYCEWFSGDENKAARFTLTSLNLILD